MRRLLSLIVLVLAAGRTALAQDEIRPGVRVRLTAPGIVADRYDGTVVGRDGDTVRVANGNSPTLSIPMSRIASLEVYRGRSHSAGALNGAKWGMLTLGGLGTLIAYSTNCGQSGQNARCNEPTADERSTVAIASVAAGAFYGVIIGAVIGRAEWTRFALERRVSLVLSGPRVGVGLAW